ncbi:MAG: bifunctional adenosylcobinamide kinase/adenosylcobinamide-phosphate guanylyltransferase [Acidimicrobiia bacterium]
MAASGGRPSGYVLLVGGARSGKSTLAVELAASSARHVLYVATAEPGDADMAARIDRHRAERPPGWATVEAPLDVGGAIVRADHDAFVVVDCVTLWVANLVFADRTDDEVLTAASALAGALATRAAPSVVVTNEVGLGVHPETALGRRYRDLLGGVNRVVAAGAWRSLLLVAGRAVRLDDPLELLR